MDALRSTAVRISDEFHGCFLLCPDISSYLSASLSLDRATIQQLPSSYCIHNDLWDSHRDRRNSGTLESFRFQVDWKIDFLWKFLDNFDGFWQ